LVLSCGFRSAGDTGTRLFGTAGEIQMTNPFHPEVGDTLQIVREGELVSTEPAAPGGELSFSPMIRHIQRVLRGLEPSRHLAIKEAAGNAASIAALLAAAGSTGRTPVQ
jgi:hypothetical protein